MTSVNLKRVQKYTFLTYLVIILLFFVGALDKLLQKGRTGLPNVLWFAIAVVVTALFLLFYTERMKRCQKNGKKCAGLTFTEQIHRYRFLIEQLVSRDFKIKYKRSVLGVFWSFLNPLLMMIVQYVVFSHLLGIRGNVEIGRASCRERV